MLDFKTNQAQQRDIFKQESTIKSLEAEVALLNEEAETTALEHAAEIVEFETELIEFGVEEDKAWDQIRALEAQLQRAQTVTWTSPYDELEDDDGNFLTYVAAGMDADTDATNEVSDCVAGVTTTPMALLTPIEDDAIVSDDEYDDEDDDYGEDMSVNSAYSDPVVASLAAAMDIEPPIGSLFHFLDDEDGDTAADY